MTATIEESDVVEAEVVTEPAPAPIPTTDDAEAPSGAVEVATPMGSLALAPDQTRLTSEQRAAIVAITNADPNDPAAIPHLRVYLHTCQRMNLDPWRRQAYLIMRGSGDRAKYTIQVGIDGYRAVAARTRLLRGAAKWYWTGTDDDPESWYVDRDARTGMVVKRRVWCDEWPESRGYPGAAMAVVEHYDALGNVVVSDAVAHWGMYAPSYPKFEWVDGAGGRRQKVPVMVDGKQVMELGDMWEKGYSHMLGKCLPGKTRIQTDRGSLTIREIVDGRLPVKVRSVDLATGEECMQPVVNYWRNDLTRDWVRITTPNGGRGNRALRLTPDHPMWTPSGWVDAGDLKPGDRVAVTSPTLTPEQEQVILGGLLGDGSLAGRKRASTLPYYAESHSVAQAQYIEWKRAALTNLSARIDKAQQSDGAGGVHPTLKMRTKAAAALYPFRGMKPTEWLHGIDDLGLAVWLMDDGSIKSTGHGSPNPDLKVYCCGFGADFADEAADWFETRYGVRPKVARRERNPYLTFGVAATRTLLDRLAPFIRYDRESNGKRWVAGPVATGAERGIAFVPVLHAERVESRQAERRYDIEVEGTHTFVVNNVVVSNCAEALLLRKVFPDEFAGTVTFEEMARADAEERRREAVEAGRARKAFVSSQRAQAPAPTAAAPASTGPTSGPAGDPGAAAPTPAAAPEQAAPEPAGLDEATVKAWLLAELDAQAEIMGAKVATMCRRQVAARKQNVEDFPASALATLVIGFRPMVAARLREVGRGEEAERYAALGADPVEDVTAALAGVVDSEPAEPAEGDQPVTVGEAVTEVVADLADAAGGEAAADEALPAHPFYDDDGSGKCGDCGEAESAVIHRP